MPRRPATITQADVARALRAAKAAGADSVEVMPDGRIRIMLVKPPVADKPAEVNDGEEIVL